MQMIQGIQVTAILRPGIQLGVFDQIANGNNQASSIAAAVGSDERGTRILLDTLIALRLLERDEAHRLTTLADAFLATGRPGYLGGTINIMAAPWIWTAFQNLPEVFQQRCLELMRRLARALKPDGRLVIHDFIAGAPPCR